MQCADCKELKDKSEFAPRWRVRTTGICRQCSNIRMKFWQKHNLGKVRLGKLKRKLIQYNIELVEYERLYQEQDGRCKICKRVSTLVIDHDHDTNRFRGLICHVCNRGLGHFADNPFLLQRAVYYLRGELTNQNL